MTFIKLLLSAIVPAAVFFGGVWLMGRLSHRELVQERLRLIPLAAERKLLSQRLTYDVQSLSRYFGALDDAALRSERHFLKLDLIFPFFYGGALAGSLIFVWTLIGRPFSPVYLILPVAVTLVADWTENLLQLHQLRQYMAGGSQALSESYVRLASTATTVKILFFTGSSLLLVILIVIALVQTFRGYGGGTRLADIQ